MKGHPKDKTFDKTTQHSSKYNSTNMHVSEIELEKQKIKLQGFVRPQHRDICDNMQIIHENIWLLMQMKP